MVGAVSTVWSGIAIAHGRRGSWKRRAGYEVGGNKGKLRPVSPRRLQWEWGGGAGRRHWCLHHREAHQHSHSQDVERPMEEAEEEETQTSTGGQRRRARCRKGTVQEPHSAWCPLSTCREWKLTALLLPPPKPCTFLLWPSLTKNHEWGLREKGILGLTISV